ncbi:hypothetical protein KY290_035588 [Solanum tuberosum]|uniref:Uncharacterized protein n=1 Tax=Solanum tuberosum TaxID=4113 RepID=A0ABQ7TRZ0_SOLTU|nr:hypothetical protein KY284_034939 [Solanum tuberosum]KAH0635180.1 hypothetical protein KY289_035095 [Solanum tuberosum]KAH0700819.1 hypothetical protein KY284_015034 [Solanum tuberosum]KAH0736883.1 hypothetical protein KY290_035588 [Solanum tuberosum]
MSLKYFQRKELDGRNIIVTKTRAHKSRGDGDNFRGGKCHGDSGSGGGYGDGGYEGDNDGYRDVDVREVIVVSTEVTDVRVVVTVMSVDITVVTVIS